MVGETVQAKYYLPAEQREWVVLRAKELGISAGQFIEMLIQNWRQYEAGKVTWQVVTGPAPGEWQTETTTAPS